MFDGGTDTGQKFSCTLYYYHPTMPWRSFKAVNVVLIGVMAKSTNIPYEIWIDTIRDTVPAKFLEVNLKAFELGYGTR